MQQESTQLSTYSTSASNRVPYSPKNGYLLDSASTICNDRSRFRKYRDLPANNESLLAGDGKVSFDVFIQPHHEKRYINPEPDRQFLYHLHSKVQICKVFENDQWLSCISVSTNYFGFFNENHSPTDRGRERSSC
jgi:hypothetical protein